MGARDHRPLRRITGDSSGRACPVRPCYSTHDRLLEGWGVSQGDRRGSPSKAWAFRRFPYLNSIGLSRLEVKRNGDDL